MKKNGWASAIFMLRLAAASLAIGSPASAGFADRWSARSEFGDEPTCSLFNISALEAPAASRAMLKVSIGWTASEGPLLWLNGRLSGTPSVRLETVGADRGWDVTLDKRGEPGMAARHAVISAGELDQLIDGVGLGQGLAITVTHPDQPPLRYLDAAGDRKIAVAMYRACVKSLTENPPAAYSQRPRMLMFQLVEYGDCGFRHIFTDQSFPPYITLYVSSTGGTMAFDRETAESAPHGGVGARRKTPDRVNAETLFGNSFELVKAHEYHLTRAQVDALIEDLANGKSRRVTMTSPDGATSTLEFGGPLSRVSGAMLNACRDVKFGSTGGSR